MELATTIELVDRAQRGEAPARELLCRRVLQMLKRFATGRLPAEARGLIETQDIVQEAAIRAMRHLEHFEFRHAGALACYLRTILKNLIRDHVRSARRRPAVNPLVEEPASATPSPMEQAIGVEGVELYERALELLKPRDREAIVLRLEQQATYEELAVELGIPTPNAARVAVKRALLRLAREMTRLTGECPSQTGAGPGAER